MPLDKRRTALWPVFAAAAVVVPKLGTADSGRPGRCLVQLGGRVEQVDQPRSPPADDTRSSGDTITYRRAKLVIDLRASHRFAFTS
jgi:hypothetical protein